MAELLKGASAAKKINADTAKKCRDLVDSGIRPSLALIRAGENEDDIFYERNAVKCCAGIGINTRTLSFLENVSEDDLLECIYSLNHDEDIHGILIFRPLPEHIDDRKVREILLTNKDVDGITEGSLAGVFTGSGKGFCPCTAEACLEILEHYGINPEGKKVCVIGRSLVTGRPVSQLMMGKNATVTVCHTRTADLAGETRRADIIISAAGHAGLITAEHVSPGQVVVDVGINSDEDGRICGDVKYDEVEKIVRAITPVPGGVGSMTTAILARHTVEAAERIKGQGHG